MELSLSHTLHLFNIFREYDGKENCAQVLEEELHTILGIKYVKDEHDCNVVSMNSLNIYDANDMQSHSRSRDVPACRGALERALTGTQGLSQSAFAASSITTSWRS